LVLRSDEETLHIEEVTLFEDSPDNTETFALLGGVVLLCSSESSAPISEKMRQSARFVLEDGTPDLVGTCVNVDDEVLVGLRQGRYWWAQ